jgi:hypothetical protein
MFTPDPKKAQSPVCLSYGKIFDLHLKVNTQTNPDNSNVRGVNDTRVVDMNGTRTVLHAKAVKWRSTEEVCVEFNRDLDKSGRPEKYFADTQGEFTVSPDISRVSFSANQEAKLTKIYFEIA